MPRKKAPHPAGRTEPYDDDETEFLHAVLAWQAEQGRRYPSYSELLGIAKRLGYRKTAPPREPLPPEDLT